MQFLSVAFATSLALASISTPAQVALSLDAAFARTLDAHPDLAVFGFTEEGLRAEAERASLKPPLTVGGSVENALGTGKSEALRSAELTVSLSSVLERGDKRAARMALVQSRIDAIGSTREAKRLDLLAEVARRYLDVLAAQLAAGIAVDDIGQRKRAVAAAVRRVQAGASPRSVQLAAQAHEVRAELDRDRAQREFIAAWRRLALLWGDQDALPGVLREARLQIPAAPEFSEILALLERTPELQRFADEARLREARLQLARTARTPDLEWEVGLRRLQESSDWGLIGSVSVPLGSASRTGPDIRAAEAELAALEFERESSELSLQSTLAQAHGRLVASAADARAIRDELIPLLTKGENAAAEAYNAGALSYLEWAQLQSETTLARRQQINATVEAQRALIEIQRLTGEDFIRADAKDSTL